MANTFVKWPKLLVWHIERQTLDGLANGAPTTVCGLVVTGEVFRLKRRPRAGVARKGAGTVPRFCKNCERMKDADTMRVQ